MKSFFQVIAVLSFLGSPLSCGIAEVKQLNVDKEFEDYWFQGKAELTSYDLEQARYGEIHNGHAVLIYVTEDFSKSKHVKLDDPASAGADAIKVMKLNFTKKFVTGIYPYSMMASVFTPIDQKKPQHSLKVSTTSQEWCGHTYTQLDETKDTYEAQLFSYFESEGDRSIKLPKTWLEDELWNLIRFNPQFLPTGSIELIPGTLYQRLSHEEIKPYQADIVLKEHKEFENLMTYIISYPELKRTLTIHFKKSFPHEIEAWEDTRESGFGSGAKILTTKAKKKERIMTDYWRKNKVSDKDFRKKLGLDESTQ